MLLAGDLGGTKTLLGLFPATGQIQPVFLREYPSRAHGSFDSILSDFLEQAMQAGLAPGGIVRACFGAAGPLLNDRIHLTHLPWVLDARALATTLHCPVRLTNDLAATATAVAQLDLRDPRDLHCLQAGEPLPNAPRVVLAAGTGLGVATLVWGPAGYQAVPGEGGHMGFAPGDPEQTALWQWLHRQNPRVTVERVVSGMGLDDIYRWRHAAAPDPDADELLGAADPSAAIAQRAAAEPASTAARAMAVWGAVFGAYAGDLALLLSARGGVFLAGGVVNKNLALIGQGPFLHAFNDKARHSALTAACPVYAVSREDLALTGAALLAAQAVPEDRSGPI